MKHEFIVLDNSGKTLDRYTIILPDGEMFGSSVNPFTGFGQYCGNVVSAVHQNHMQFYDRSTGCYKAYAIEWALKEYLRNTADKQVKFSKLPNEVQQYIGQLTAETLQHEF